VAQVRRPVWRKLDWICGAAAGVTASCQPRGILNASLSQIPAPFPRLYRKHTPLTKTCSCAILCMRCRSADLNNPREQTQGARSMHWGVVVPKTRFLIGEPMLFLRKKCHPNHIVVAAAWDSAPPWALEWRILGMAASGKPIFGPRAPLRLVGALDALNQHRCHHTQPGTTKPHRMVGQRDEDR
jgi:hypothetical protein